MLRLPIALLLWLSLSTLSTAVADVLRLQSPHTRVSLLELYTSEGCSSCPPADRWLSSLKNDARLWRQVVPVAFHVDYWDYLGWQDRFADQRYSARQQNYAHHGLVRTVYTPGWVLDGAEWRGWFRYHRLKPASAETVGSLRLVLDDDRAMVVFMPQTKQPETLELHLAMLGFELSTPVQAGENRGRTLNHDFVVLGYRAVLLPRRGESYGINLPFPNPRFKAPRRAVVAWVTRLDDPRSLQALGGWLEDDMN